VVSVAGFLAALLSVLGFAFWAAMAVDRAAIAREVQFVRAGIQKVFDRVPQEQESITIWDDAVIHTRERDEKWMTDNVGAWVHAYFGHTAVFVLDDLDRPIHAMHNGLTLDVRSYADHAEQIAPLVSRLRAQLQASTGEEGRGAMGAQDIVVTGGVPAVFSVKPIVPYTGTVSVGAGQEYLHVSIQAFDRAVLEEIAQTYDLQSVRLLGPGEDAGPATAPIANSKGDVLARIGWDAYRPGAALIFAAAPGLAVGVAIGITLLALLLSRLRRTASELQASEAQAHFLAFHDTLTGLPNRSLFEDRLRSALATARHTGMSLALHSIDLDRFKNINDTRGHPAGDELIRLVAGRLSAVLREGDTVARLGGDEFILLQVGISDAEEAESLANRLLASIGKPCDLLGEAAPVSASIGVVMASPDCLDREELLRRADIALYEAKAAGRARFAMFTAEMDEVIKRRRLVEEELRFALEFGQHLSVVYQPLFAPDGQSIIGAEALARWHHPELGWIAPDYFIQIAEERALIEPLGEFVLREAASFAVEAQLPWVAVNVSPVQFRDPLFVPTVLRVLSETGLSPKRLQLEITERVLLENSTFINGALGQLRAAGIRIALDDFGTGYSSMSYLRHHAIDKLKIDRSFVAELGQSADADAIIRAMVALARSLRLRVTAEGVETIEQRDHLAAIGCHELQGYLMSRPVAGSALMQKLADDRATGPAYLQLAGGTAARGAV
jgi:diguanylate cyclase (GGDEF)-like protein